MKTPWNQKALALGINALDTPLHPSQVLLLVCLIGSPQWPRLTEFSNVLVLFLDSWPLILSHLPIIPEMIPLRDGVLITGLGGVSADVRRHRDSGGDLRVLFMAVSRRSLVYEAFLGRIRAPLVDSACYGEPRTARYRASRFVSSLLPLLFLPEYSLSSIRVSSWITSGLSRLVCGTGLLESTVPSYGLVGRIWELSVSAGCWCGIMRNRS